MRMKFITIVLFMVFISIPAFAQNVNIANINRPEPVQMFEKGQTGEQNRAANMGKTKALREAVKAKGESAKKFKNKVANEHRSAVANFVQGLLDVADRQELGGIGEKVREIARQQNASEDKVTPNLEKVKNKNKIRKFLFGTDFRKTKEIKKEMQEAQKRLRELERIKADVENSEDKAAIEEQIKNFQDNINQVLKEVQAEEESFSLFGWIKKIFI